MDKYWVSEKDIGVTPWQGNAFSNAAFSNADVTIYKADEVDADKKKDTARIKELEEENKQLDVSATERQLKIYRLRKALVKIEEWTHPECYLGVDVIATIRNVATEALKDKNEHHSN